MGYKTRSAAIIIGMTSMVFLLLLLIDVFFNLYGWGFIVGGTVLWIFFQYLISPIIIGWIFRINWMDEQEVATNYPHIFALIEKVVRKYELTKPPRFGIIQDGNPNAFTYGWTKNSARLVITQGIIDLLDNDEQQAVVGHELGHIVHQDFIVMTFVNAIPIIFYTLYRILLRSSRYTVKTSRSNSKAAGYVAIAKVGVGIMSYLFYIIGTFLALMLSRWREYWADQFSAEITENPDALSTSLVKIAYGILQEPDKTQKRTQQSQYVKALGIFDRRSAKELAFSATNGSKELDHNIFAKAAAWDLYHPWAKYFEIFSTHPLPAKRIKKLNDIGVEKFGQENVINLKSAKQEFKKQMGSTAIDEFIGEVFMQILPSFILTGWIITSIILILTGFDFSQLPFANTSNPLYYVAVGFILFGLALLLRNAFKYRGGYEEHGILDLIGTINVSPIRPVPTVTQGVVIGRGVPGLFWSEDLVIRDEQGIMLIDYDYGIQLINTLFGIFKAKELQGKTVEVSGWYRRGPSPYIQVRRIKLLDGSDKMIRNHKKGFKNFWAGICIVIGLGLWLLPSMI